jgi:hypothetical protein
MKRDGMDVHGAASLGFSLSLSLDFCLHSDTNPLITPYSSEARCCDIHDPPHTVGM